ncbi:hypothetical protein O0235_04480 [Tepidiforma flava]|uniref:Uncharacterized protein n=1 Tax=Tepidiforma flava TaxID=3004094 RepID=A0ABY7M9Q0_9CHLR|nr:hypothetical protein [Tepidiforma flava]WBL36820.1 hypothetical protein O0235_04480 [Tepidiforma flava]
MTTASFVPATTMIEVAALGLIEGGVHDVLAVEPGDADGGDGAVEGDIADAEGSGRRRWSR